MLDRETVKRWTEAFKHPNHCMIHAETNNDGTEVVLGGDFESILWSIGVEIDRVATLMGTNYNTVMVMVNERHHKGRILTKGEVKKVIGGYDWQDEWEKSKAAELKKDAEAYARELEQELTMLKRDNISLSMQLADVKRTSKRNLEEKENVIRQQSKELRVLEHKIDGFVKKAI